MAHHVFYGGSFDPPHNAHLEVVTRLLKAVQPTRLVLAPTGRSPFKDPTDRSIDDRRALIEAFIEAVGDPRVVPYWDELERPGASYTVDTLETLVGANPAVRWSLAIGTDHLAAFGRWKDHQRILELADLVHVVRAGYPISDVEWPVAVETEGPDRPLSSTEIREALQAGEDARRSVPAPVMKVIQERGLYGARRRVD